MDMGNINDVSFSIIDDTISKDFVQNIKPNPKQKPNRNIIISFEEKLRIQKSIEESDINLSIDLFATKN
jgi:hypothetical protein